MLKARSRRLTMALAAGALTMSGAAGALAAEASPGGGQRAADVQTADDGGGINPMCMLRPQDCMYPPADHDRDGGGNAQTGPDGGSNYLVFLRHPDYWTPPRHHHGSGDATRRASGSGGGVGAEALASP